MPRGVVELEEPCENHPLAWRAGPAKSQHQVESCDRAFDTKAPSRDVRSEQVHIFDHEPQPFESFADVLLC